MDCTHVIAKWLDLQLGFGLDTNGFHDALMLGITMGLLSLLPVFIAVGLSLWTKRALFIVLWCFVGALLIKGGNPFTALLYVVDPLFIDSVADRDGMKVIVSRC